MYNNIGSKIKTLAKVIAALGIIGSIIYGIVLIIQGEQVSSYSSYLSGAGSTLTGTGIAVMILGSLGSWISSWALYAIGDTNDKITKLCSKSGIVENESTDAVSADEITKKKYCPKCGVELSQNSAFCKQCGTQLNDKSSEHIGKCDMCDKENAVIYPVKIVDDLGTRYRNVCDECKSKYNCQ